MTEPFSEARQVDRRDIIEILGVTYAHSGGWRSPIYELPGKRIVDDDPLSDRQMFSSERIAVDHVQAMARREAEQTLPLLRHAQQRMRRRIAIWLAQKWVAFRRMSLGTVATSAILESQIQLYERIMAGRYDPPVIRMPRLMRVPAVLLLDTPVWVLDTANFPKKPAVLREDRISEQHYAEAPADSPFDFQVRYGLAITRGRFLYDHVDTQGHDRMESLSGINQVFIRQEAAEAALQDFRRHVEKMLSMSSHPTLLPSPDLRHLPLNISAPQEETA